jgi:hypothetical protein
MECVTQTIAKIKDKFQTVLQRKITQQITEHEGKERDLLFVTECLPWQRKKRLRESLAFGFMERCSSCDLEVLEGVLGVHGGVLGLAADWISLQWRSRGKSGWKRWSDGWLVCAEGRLGRGVAQDLFLYSHFWVSLLQRGGVVGSWWRQRVALLFRFSCPYVPWQPLSAIGFFLLSASFLLLKMYFSIPGGLD